MSENNSSLVSSTPQALSVFQYQDREVRSFLSGDEPYFVAADVCAILGYANTSKAISDNVDTEDRGYVASSNGVVIPPLTDSYTPGALLVINESGLYALILGSRKEEAKRVKRWVTSEVLPAIRKTGSYSAKPLTDLEVLKRHVALLESHEQQLVQHDDRISRIEARQTGVEQGTKFFTVVGYIVHMKLPSVDIETAKGIGRSATRLSKTLGYEIGKTSDPRFGDVNTYHEYILSQVVNRK